jgi:hypothetical protein
MFQPKLRRAVVSAVLVSALSLLSVPNAGAGPRGRSNREGRDASVPSVRVAIRSYSLLDLLISLWGKAGVQIDPHGRTSPQADDSCGVTDSSARTSPEEKR